jgi:hypothetical protein
MGGGDEYPVGDEEEDVAQNRKQHNHGEFTVAPAAGTSGLRRIQCPDFLEADGDCGQLLRLAGVGGIRLHREL